MIFPSMKQKRNLSVVLLVFLSACTFMHTPSPYLPDRNGIEVGETITVHGNENVYTIAHEHNVSMRELIALNELKPPFEVRPGQSLVLPAGGSSFAGEMKPPEAAPLAPVEKNVLAPITPPAVSSQQLEPIALPPVSQAPASASAAPQSLIAPPPAATANVQPAAQPAVVADQVQSLNRPSPAPKQTATTMASAAPASSAAEEASITMIWPIQGPILSSFGSKGANTHNDGIDIGAPKGAPVVAAAPGTVVYAGDEMKGFGNLVLIRHQGDWVTAYAHLDRVLVKKDSIVAQGDMIGTVGKTGNVPSPQLHFETRQSGKPVDPAQVIKNAP
jgi:murein DD-endopeptidase MepM/ murein hydrolase activator NlpD